MDNWKWLPDKNEPEPMPTYIEGFPVESVEYGEEHIYDIDKDTGDWILVEIYDIINRRWIDVRHLKSRS